MKKPLNTPAEASTVDSNPAASAPSTISEHAKSLGTLPKELMKGRRKKQRKWTGFVEGQRMWVGRRVLLPTGETAVVVEVSLRMAKLRTARLNPDGDPLIVYIPVERLKLWKHPSAVALGRRKLQVQERKSERKAITARENGGKPPHPGKVRGRPRKDGRSAFATQPPKPYEPRLRAAARCYWFAWSLLELGCTNETLKLLGAGEGLRVIELEKRRAAWQRLSIRTLKAGGYV